MTEAHLDEGWLLDQTVEHGGNTYVEVCPGSSEPAPSMTVCVSEQRRPRHCHVVGS